MRATYSGRQSTGPGRRPGLARPALRVGLAGQAGSPAGGRAAGEKGQLPAGGSVLDQAPDLEAWQAPEDVERRDAGGDGDPVRRDGTDGGQAVQDLAGERLQAVAHAAGCLRARRQVGADRADQLDDLRGEVTRTTSGSSSVP